ncbi:MAG: 3-dehydroquinate synthase [Sedimentisphaerales bacterium]|nr:3-dehydroquinate synthase [Sedimentisphaerales bacterium]
MTELEIKVPASPVTGCKIKIGTNILGSLWKEIDSDYGKLSKFIVTDENLVSAGHLAKLTSSRDVPHFIISPAGEISKNINTVISIIEAMEKAYLGRDTIIIALGGGTVGDIAGFAAAVFKRGVPVIQIPTTTVAQADSSVGGKTGVDSSLSKNAFGAFWHPVRVYIDVAALASLDERQYRAGLVESVKHAIIADSEYFLFLENNLDSILKRKPDVLKKTAYRNCRVKGSVVEEDPHEKNKRRILNYGHTIGHAVEAASGYELLHGEAVSIGIIAAGLIEQEMGLAEHERLDRIRKILKKLGTPIQLPKNITENEIIDLMKRDKKAVNKWPKFVLISNIGEVYTKDGQYAVEVKPEIVKKILKEMKKD